MNNNTFILFCDGGSRGNPGPSACGYVVFELLTNIELTKNTKFDDVKNLIDTAKIVIEKADFVGHSTTNNVAEWSGLTHGLSEIIAKFGVDNEVLVCMDSELVVKQTLGIYKVKQPHLMPFLQDFKSLQAQLNKVVVSHIYRENNKLADALVNQCLDKV